MLKRKSLFKKLFILFVLLLVLGLSFPIAFSVIVQRHYNQYIYDINSAPSNRAALVFGAGIYEGGILSDMLRDRMDVAIALYETGKVDKLLLSGDNRFENYDEPGAMMQYALFRGVDEADIQPDYGGRRTYDTCYRAKYIFQVEEAILVTQTFHLPRALMLCNQLGIKAIGVSANLQPYVAEEWLAAREVGATLQSGWDLTQKNPPPVMGEPIPLIEQ